MGLKSAQKFLQRAQHRGNKKNLPPRTRTIRPIQVTEPVLRQQEHLASKHLLRIDNKILPRMGDRGY